VTPGVTNPLPLVDWEFWKKLTSRRFHNPSESGWSVSFAEGVFVRGYIRKYQGIKDEKAPLGWRTDFWFAVKESAMFWETLKDAEIARDLFERQGIKIDLPGGGKHVCVGFEIEERKPGEYVIFCDAPFTPTPRKEAVKEIS
jgi:hypothetical protein